MNNEETITMPLSEIRRLNDELIAMKMANMRLARNQGLMNGVTRKDRGIIVHMNPTFWQRAQQAFRILTNK